MFEKIGKKLAVEAIGTAMLTSVACGVATITQSIIATALAFGLVLTILCYTIGPISGGHFNPAVSIAKLINKEIKGEECIAYIFAQIIGAICGSLILGLITLQFESLGSNGISALLRTGNELTPISYAGASLVEIFLTFIFVLAVLFSTGKTSKTGNATGVFVGGVLALVHLLGFGLTGTSVNPARSVAPALIEMIGGNHGAAKLLPVFIFAPIIGAIFAGITYKFFVAEHGKAINSRIKFVAPIAIALLVVVAFLGFIEPFLTYYNEVGYYINVSGLDITFGNKIYGVKMYTVSIGNIISFVIMIFTFIMFVLAAILGLAKKEKNAKKLVIIASIASIISGILLILAPKFATFSENMTSNEEYTETLTNVARYSLSLMFASGLLGLIFSCFIKVENKNKEEKTLEPIKLVEEASEVQDLENNEVENIDVVQEEKVDEETIENSSIDESIEPSNQEQENE